MKTRRPIGTTDDLMLSERMQERAHEYYMKDWIEEVAQLEEFIGMFTVEDLRGVFNHYMEMQKQAIHGQSGEFTVNFWKEQAGKQMKIIEAFEALAKTKS